MLRYTRRLMPARTPRALLFGLIAALFLTACTPAAPNAPVGAQVGVQAPSTTEAVTTSPPTQPAEEAAALPTGTPAADSAAAAPAPSAPDLAAVSIELEPLVQGLEQPLFVTHAGDESGRLFIVEKVGRIRIFQDGKLLDTPFLDISDKVSLSSEQGLLGLAFTPDYASSGTFYINYTNRIGDTVVARYSVSPADPNQADAASELPILQLDQPAPNHNGGMIAFGPDGYLYIGMGDGGAADDRFGNGQNPQTLLAKMLRINVNSDPDDPTPSRPTTPGRPTDGQDMRNEIWALGLRNPWRWSFDRQTNDLWIADVGQNMIEEINVVPNAPRSGGLNFGWPIMEGKSCFQAENCDQTGSPCL